MYTRLVMAILGLIILSSISSFGTVDTISRINFKQNYGKIYVNHIVQSDPYLAFTSRSEKTLFYSIKNGPIDTIDIHESVKMLLQLDLDSGIVKKIVGKPNKSNIYFRYYHLDFIDAQAIVNGVLVVEYDSVGAQLPYIFGLSVQVNLESRNLGIKVHHLPNHEKITAFENIIVRKSKRDKPRWIYDVRYWNWDDTLSFVIDGKGPRIPADTGLFYTNKSSVANHLIYQAPAWGVHYKINSDSSVMIFSNGYEIINVSDMRLIYRSNDLYSIASPLFSYKGDPYCLVELINHKKALETLESIDRKMLNLKDNKMYPLPPSFSWFSRFIIPKQLNTEITPNLYSFSIGNDGVFYILKCQLE